MNKPIGWLQEFSERIGEGTEFAATLTCIPFEEGSEWMGTITFDNPDLNWPLVIDETWTLYNDWHYSRIVPGGTYLNTLLMNWHGEIVALIQRVRQKEAQQLADANTEIARLRAALVEIAALGPMIEPRMSQFATQGACMYASGKWDLAQIARRALDEAVGDGTDNAPTEAR